MARIRRSHVRARVTLSTALALCLSSVAVAQQSAPPPGTQTPAPATASTPSTAAAAAAPAKLAFTGDVGFVLFTVKAEGAGDFEAFLGKVKEALAQGTKPEYAQMAAGWNFFKVTEGAQSGQVLYACVMAPLIKATVSAPTATATTPAPAVTAQAATPTAPAITPSVDYDPVRILMDLMPAEAIALYPKFKDAVVSVNRLSLVSAIKMAP